MDRRELLETLRLRLSAEDYARVAQELADADASTDPIRTIEDVLRASSWLQLPDVPPVVSQDLHALIGETPLKAAHTGVLIFDSRRDRDLVGVRGGMNEDGWSQTYTSPAADVAVDIWSTGGTCELDGHVMSHGGDTAAYRATISGPRDVSVDSDALGRFRIEDLPHGSYVLTVDNAQVTLSMTVELEPVE